MPEFLIDLLPMMIVQSLLLIGIIPLARRVSRGWAWTWIVLALIPGIGALVFILLLMKALAVILARADLLSGNLGSSAADMVAQAPRRSPQSAAVWPRQERCAS
jgi:hypothetical protein